MSGARGASRGPWRAVRLGLLGAAGVALAHGAALAQLSSDEVPAERTIPAKDQIDADLQRSRLRLGPIRLIPSISIPNAGYDSNVFGSPENPVSDWTVTVRGGLRFLVPMGSKMYFVGDALPQYTWYDKLDERRTYGGVAKASLFGFFNRMTVQLTGSGSRDFVNYSTELPARVFTKTGDALAAAEVQVTHAFSVFGKGEYVRVRYDQAGQLPTEDVTINDRDDKAVRGGVRYRISPRLSLSAAVEQTWSDFQTVAETRNNSSRGYIMGVFYESPRLYVSIQGGYRQGDPRDGSSFPAYSTPTGSFFVSFYPMRLLELQAYGRRIVSYSISTGAPYYFENQIGGGLNVQATDRLLLRGYAQTGPNQYPAEVIDGVRLPERRDERTLYGGGVSFIALRDAMAGRPAVLTGLVTRIDTKSNTSIGDSAVTRYTIVISFSGELVR